MAKLKLSLPSGSEVEKTVISYFKSNETNYLILDAESVGSMGLPIILVSKVVGDKVIKIADQNEWQQVKSYLKNIISGGKMEYIPAPITLPADEVYYTQLTLPVASFDILKSSYIVENVNIDVVPMGAENIVSTTTPIMPQIEERGIEEQPINMSTDIVSEIPMQADIAAPTNNVSEPIINDMIAPLNNSVISEEVPVADVAPVTLENNADMTVPLINEGLNSSENVNIAPIIEEPIAISDPVVGSPMVEENSVMDSEPIVVSKENKMDFSDCKTMFMQACENMFDALAAKIEAELKNK